MLSSMPDHTGNDPHWQPTLQGSRLVLRPLMFEDFEPLFEAARDPLIWEQHSARERYRREEFEKFFENAIASRGALAAIERSTGRIIGSSRYYDHDPNDSSVVMGYTFLERAYWGGTFNGELKNLMLSHAFERVSRVFFHASPGNTRSRRALERIGATLHSQGTIDVGGVPSERVIYVLSSDDFQHRSMLGA